MDKQQTNCRPYHGVYSLLHWYLLWLVSLLLLSVHVCHSGTWKRILCTVGCSSSVAGPSRVVHQQMMLALSIKMVISFSNACMGCYFELLNMIMYKHLVLNSNWAISRKITVSFFLQIKLFQILSFIFIIILLVLVLTQFIFWVLKISLPSRW